VSSDRNVADVGNQIKTLFEGKKWAALGDLLKLPSLWYVYQPLSVPEALAMAERVLRDAQEVEVTLLRIVRTESSDGYSRGSYQCRLGWFEPSPLKQQEVSFDLHLGFRTQPEAKLEYLGITEASPEPSLPAEEPAKAPPREAAAPAPLVPEGASPEVTVYVPVRLPASLVQAHLRKSLGS